MSQTASLSLAPVPEKDEQGPAAVEVLHALLTARGHSETRPQQEQMVEAVETAIEHSTHLVVQAGTGVGKALDLATPIPTPTGWTTMGSLKAGDQVFDECGRICSVLAAHPVRHGRACFRVTFDDGSSLIADEEHLWATRTRELRRAQWRHRAALSNTEYNSTARYETLLKLRAVADSIAESGYMHTVDSALVVLGESATAAWVSARRAIYGRLRREELFDLRPILARMLENLARKGGSRLDQPEPPRYEIITTSEMAATVRGQGGARNHAIDVAAALALPKQELPIDPYALGAWLGDGNTGGSGFTTADQQIVEELEARGYFVRKLNSGKYRYSIHLSPSPATSRWEDSFTKRLGTLGVLTAKRIPVCYLRASFEQRLDLLRGIVDTDGTVMKHNGLVEISLCDADLIADVRELVHSLGIKTTFSEGPATITERDPHSGTTSRRTVGIRYRLRFTTALPVALLTAKRDRLPKEVRATRGLRYVVGVDQVESRPVRCITVDSPSHLFLAGESMVPTHNSLAYIVPAAMSGQRVLISTATKQLSEQILRDDLPLVAETIKDTLGRELVYSLLKGRQNYLCLQRKNELISLDEQAPDEQEGLFDAPAPRASPMRPTSEDIAHLNELLKWADETPTGDRSDAPPVPDKVWDEVSTDAGGCPGARICIYADDCFAEKAREQAKLSDIVVTNHAQVGQDLNTGSSLFGDWDVLVADEVHELRHYLSSAWGTDLNARLLGTELKNLFRRVPTKKSTEAITDLSDVILTDVALLEASIDTLPGGLLSDLPEDISVTIESIVARLGTVIDVLKAATVGNGPSKQTVLIESLAAKAIDLRGNLHEAGGEITPGVTVRWVEKGWGTNASTMKTAPLWVGPQLMETLGSRTMIATSATITVNNSFDSFITAMAWDKPPSADVGARDYTALDVGTPFDYPKQGMLYIPNPKTFPAPTGKDRVAHTEAVLDTITSLITAAGGRTLALFTTRKAANAAAEHLRDTITTPVLAQGDAPPSQLIDEFTHNETTTLCATMGFWHGVNTPGASCSLVIMDKIPFAPMDDPLMSSQRQYVDDAGRSGFDEVFVAEAAIMLAQGAGRLIRSGTDRGVVAILDPRLRTTRYGTSLIRSLPPMRTFDDQSVVEGALRRLTGTP